MASRIVIIAAVSDNGVIGRAGTLPWKLPADLKRFKERTTGHAVIMGRRTFEDQGKALPSRRNVVVTSNDSWSGPGAERAPSLQRAIQMCAEHPLVFICGGSTIYAQSFSLAHEIDLTRVHATIEGDAFFPCFNPALWTLDASTLREADDRNPHAMTIQTWSRA